MIVTIDGPAGAGKSTVARKLAHRLGFRFLDTGAMYRAVALAADERQLDWELPQRLAELAREIDIMLGENRVFVDGREVTEQIRTPRTTALTHYAADNPGVRAHLVELQRQAAGEDNIVTEGRDQGTIVFPHAQCKIYLTASPEERARRRTNDLQARGQAVPVEEVLAQQNLRDERDTSRTVGPLIAADDAVEVMTDGLGLEEVVDRLETLVRSRMER